MKRILKTDDRFPSGFCESIHPDEMVCNPLNKYIGGVDQNIDPLTPIQSVASILFNKFNSIKNGFDKSFGGNPKRSETPSDAYDKMLKTFEEAVPSEISYDFNTRFHAMVGIINGNRKAGIPYIHKLTYDLIGKMVDAGEEDIARSLDLEYEMKK